MSRITTVRWHLWSKESRCPPHQNSWPVNWIFFEWMGIITDIDHIMASPTTSIKPALTPPPGIVPNFVDPPSQSYAIIIAIVFFLVSTTPFVLVRLYTRYYINQKLWWDDCKWNLHSISRLQLIFKNLGFGDRESCLTNPLPDSIVLAWVRASSSSSWSKQSLQPPNTEQLGLFGLTGVLVKLLQYGIGVDLWNVPAEDGARFTKVSIGSLWKRLIR